MIERVAPPCLGVSVAHIVLKIKRVHIIELRRLQLVKEFLIQRVEVLSVVHNHFAICSCHQPLVVGFQVRVFKCIDRCVDRDQRVNLDGQRRPRIHEDQDNLSVFGCCQNVVSTWQYLDRNNIVDHCLLFLVIFLVGVLVFNS